VTRSPRTRRTAALAASAAALASIAAGCGGAAQEPAPLPPVPSGTTASATPISPGQVLTASPTTPRAVARALAGREVVVMAFLDREAADDATVAAALRRTSHMARRGVHYFTYSVGAPNRAGDLLARLNVVESPTVAVIGPSGRLTNLWTGLVDASLLRQSIADAKSS
jgi:hypothetical protein